MEHLGQFIVNHWQLCLVFFVILVALFINEAKSQKDGAKGLSPQAAVTMINHENAVVIDIRSKEQFILGHIIDAIQVDSTDLEQKRMDKYKNKCVILACEKGLQSNALINKMRSQGYENLFVLQGGIDAWRKAGFPLVKGKSKPVLRAV